MLNNLALHFAADISLPEYEAIAQRAGRLGLWYFFSSSHRDHGANEVHHL